MRRVWFRKRALVVLLVLFAVAPPMAQGDEEPLHARIDALLERASLGPHTELSSDSAFLRRAYLDLIGTIPDAATARAFLDDTSPDKRQALVDRLLAHPRFARHMANTFDVMLMERRRQRRLPGPEWTISDQDWREYLRKSIAEEKPLNQLAREILGADGVDPALRPAVKFYFDRDADPDLLARDIGRLFFGRDLQCAQCHDHPLVDDYLQSEYYGVKAFVNRGVLFDDKKEKKLYYAENAEGEVTYTSVFTGEGRQRVLPRLPQSPPMSEPVLAKEEAYVVAPAKDVRPIPKFSRRAQLAALATDGSNDAFNRNLANRLWSMMMGRGLAHPLDMVHSGNPAIESELLTVLADDLVKNDFRLKHFLREVALSRAYQRESAAPARASLALDPSTGQSTVESWKAEAEKLAAELTTLEEAAQAASTTVDASYEKFSAAATKRDAAEKARAEAKKASDELAAALSAAVTESKTKEDILKALVEARVKADAAVAKLPDDKPLAEAAAQFKTRANEVDTQLAALRKTVKEKTPQVQAASLKLAEADKQLEPAVAELTLARGALESAETTLRDAQEKLRVATARQSELATRMVDGQAVLDYLALESAANAAQTASQSANEQYAAIKAQTDATQQQILEAEEAGLAAAEKLADARKAADDAWKTLAEKATLRFTLAPLRPLSPEQLAWATMQAVGLVDQQSTALAEQVKKDVEAKKDLSPEQRTGEETQLLEARVDEKLRGKVGPFVSLFGQEPGQSPTFQATVHQALFLSNGGTLAGWLKPGGNNLTERLSKLEDSAAVAEELYLSVLTRRPNDEEHQSVAEYLDAAQDARAEAVRDMVWALLTSTEFRFNH